MGNTGVQVVSSVDWWMQGTHAVDGSGFDWSRGVYATDVLDDNDFYPWGGVVPGVGKTTSNNTIKFTGQYRDTDTMANLDYFGARYYSNTIGRFMSPDWAAKPVTVPYAKFGDPQSLNLYSYTENGPINRVDADGHSLAGFDGFMAPRGNEVDQYNVSHGAYGVDADYDSTTNEATGQTTVNRPGSQPQNQATLLGNSVAITYAKGISAKDQLTASGKIISAVDLLNANATS